MADSLLLGSLQNPGHRNRISRPPRRLRAELRPAPRRELVELRLAIVLREPPLGLDPSPLFQPVERRVQCALFNLQLRAARLGDPARDCVSVSWTPAQRLEHEDIEGPLQQCEVVVAHDALASPETLREYAMAPDALQRRRVKLGTGNREPRLQAAAACPARCGWWH